MTIASLKNDDTAVMKNFKNGLKHLYDVFTSEEDDEMEYLLKSRPKVNRAGQAFVTKYEKEDKEINAYSIYSYLSDIKSEKDLQGFLNLANYNSKFFTRLCMAIEKDQFFATRYVYPAGLFARYIHFLIANKKPVSTEDKKLAALTFKKFEKDETFQKGMIFVEKLLSKRKVKNKAGRKTDKEIVLEFKFRQKKRGRKKTK